MIDSAPADQAGDGARDELASLAAELRELRLRAGDPSIRAIAAKAHVSHDTVHRVLRCGQTGRVPRWETLVLVTRALGRDPDQFQDLWARAVREADQRRRPAPGGAPLAGAGPDAGRQVGLSSDFPRSVWDQLVQAGRALAYPADVWIVTQGDDLPFVLLIVSGYVKKFRVSPNGYEVLHDVLSPGQMYGHEAALTGAPSGYGLRTATQVTGVQIPLGRFRQVLSASPQVTIAVAGDLARQIEAQARRIQGQTDLPFGRVVNILLTLADAAGTPRKGGGKIVDIPLAQDELASMAQISRSTLVRMLSRLRDAGLVRMQYRRLIVIDREGLARLAAQDAGMSSF